MNTAVDPLDVIRKRLSWRASRRGIKEMDLLVGGFAEQHLATMNAAELQAFEAILDIPDQYLLAWVTQQEPVPLNQQSSLLNDLLNFRPSL